MNYYACSFSNPENETLKDMLMELLGAAGFDSFMDTDEGFEAYCQEKSLDETELDEIIQMEQFSNVKLLKKELIPDQDWNATWEASYEPVIINELCRIKAPFHQVEGSYKYDLIIEPKMSFGTAHHETTSQIIELMLQSDFKGLNVLDMGSGTGVLAILAKKLGSSMTVAIDNDEWAYRNALDNVKLNDETEIVVELGDANSLNNRQFDIILANINRNILLRDMKEYVKCLVDGGKIFFSGFYEEDLKLIAKEAECLGLKYVNHVTKNNWTAAVFIK
ncbi:MAG: 50S ribosomal protein L11 methyltransferase [Lentimicrobiaceae bacterium]|nr:50S ribosomal protein L11 methyltransferase [Lentimicrobiaceae bacterium]MBE6346331.1 50S ribosomal protein L11 methyltransferase [Lentimicrobiaceae bacterium]